MMTSASHLTDSTVETALDDGRLYLDTFTGMKRVTGMASLRETTATVYTDTAADARTWRVERRDLLVEDKDVADYRRARANRSEEEKAEERAEMRAAFGEGETVINVLTGERIEL